MTLEGGKQFEALLKYLRDGRGFDYTGYKRNTIVRRIAKRCTELGLTSFTAYQDYLQVHAGEFAILFDKILINVTEFFRDPAAWDYIRRDIVPKLVEKGGAIRIWSTGTASGQEAYTAAILFCEALGPEAFLRRVKIYATDVDDDTLNTARSGYSEKELESLPANFRSRYFELQGGRYTFKTGLRRALIFGRHDLLQDAPISRLDLLICRNTLMYFTAETQGRILARFHYALDDDGYMFLGRAEMLLMHGSIFEPVDLKQRVFKKIPRPPLRERLMILAQTGSSEASEQANRQIRLHELASEGLPFPQLVVDAIGNLALANVAARRLLNIRPDDVGRALRDLELSYRPAELRPAIDRAREERREVSLTSVRWEHGNTVRFVDVIVSPLYDDDRQLLGTRIRFVDVTSVRSLQDELRHSKQEVETAYEELQSTNEELETTNEELQSTVEELETTNEELQSTNEELETMNEELQSTNEELQTMNEELRNRSTELNSTNAFLEAVFTSLRSAVVVLDCEMRVQVWNAGATNLWGLRPDEVRRAYFFGLDIGLPVNQLQQSIKDVLNGHAYRETSVAATSRTGKPFQCRVSASALTGLDAAITGVILLMEEQVRPS